MTILFNDKFDAFFIYNYLTVQYAGNHVNPTQGFISTRNDRRGFSTGS